MQIKQVVLKCNIVAQQYDEHRQRKNSDFVENVGIALHLINSSQIQMINHDSIINTEMETFFCSMQ